MIYEITEAYQKKIKNEAFRRYADSYLDIVRDYYSQIAEFGLPLEEKEERESCWKNAVSHLADAGISVENGEKSFCYKWISTACKNCRRGLDMVTFYFSLYCSRNCYFCFNPNQEGYEYYRDHERDLLQELRELYQEGKKFTDIALSGGEPLLYKKETAAFFRLAKELYGQAYTRLYTCGDSLDEACLKELREAGLDEIRFSIKLDDSPEEVRKVLDKIALSKTYIPQVMVELPVFPGRLEQMRELLLELDMIGINGINLLEFCFPLHNIEEFRQRGYRLKNPLYRVIYNYNYGGGLPVAGSEEDCFQLLLFAADQGLKMGVHYCSVENKFTEQIYQQNKGNAQGSGLHSLSGRDYFLKSAKVFGSDAADVEGAFRIMGMRLFQYNSQHNYLEFPLSYIKKLRKRFPDLEIGLSYSVVETREDGLCLREVKIDATTPELFDEKADI